MVRPVGMVVAFICLSSTLFGQRLADLEHADSLVTDISDVLYNQQFNATQTRIDQLAKALPNHPIIDLLYALNIVWKTLPDSNTEEFPQIEAYLHASIEKANKILDENEDDVEATFFQLMAHGLLAQYYAEQNSTFKAVSEAKRAYGAVTKGMKMKDQFVEYYFSSGLYNYYREKYPEIYPIYKSFVWVFKSGDKSKGLEQLAYASRYAPLSRVEAAHYLAFINMRLENNPERALDIIVDLKKRYPKNVYFNMLWIETLDLLEQMPLCKEVLQKYLKHKQKYTRMFANAYVGVYAEKVEKNLRKARTHYLRAVELSESFEYAYHPISVAYAGLARVSDSYNDESAAIDYYKKVRKLAVSPQLIEEAETYIKAN